MAATGYEKDIDLPGPRPRTRGLLLDVARQIPASELSSAGVNRLTAGVTWLPWGPIALTNEAANCDVVYSKGTRDLPSVMYGPAFLIYDSLNCGTLSFMENELWSRLEHNFQVGLSAAFAAQLETAADGGLGLQGGLNYGGDANADYAPAGAAVAAGSLRVAFNFLESYLASKILNSEGTIHLTPGLLTLAKADYLVEWDGTSYRTATGTYVVGDAGHTGLSTPQGGAAGSAAAPWIYATSDVWYAVLQQPKLEEAETGEGYKLIRKNLDRPILETWGLIVFDPNILAAAHVTVA